MQQFPKRKWPRLKEHDYSEEGFYFLTICTKGKKCLLSIISAKPGETVLPRLTEYGRITEAFLKRIPGIDRYVIMPNHIHLIIHKTNGNPISNDIRAFKGLVTKRIGFGIWQDYYYDHVIRDEADYRIKCNYIDENPAKWAEDAYFSP